MQQYNLFTKYKFFSLGSGSSGNCYYLGTQNKGILIDAGIGVRMVRKTLKEYGIAIENIQAVLVTHDHNDHIRSVAALGDKYHIPVYATQPVHDSIQRNKYLKADLVGSKRFVEKEKTFELHDMKITPFEVPHDSSDNVGYHIAIGDQTLVFITDIGDITDRITYYAGKANHLVVEANYDPQMLETGKYPEYLKTRIKSGRGHLSNILSAELISSVYHPDMNTIMLCHLSQDNNRPEIAFRTVAEKLKEKGVIAGQHVRLETLSRHHPSGLNEF